MLLLRQLIQYHQQVQSFLVLREDLEFHIVQVVQSDLCLQYHQLFQYLQSGLLHLLLQCIQYIQDDLSDQQYRLGHAGPVDLGDQENHWIPLVQMVLGDHVIPVVQVILQGQCLLLHLWHQYRLDLHMDHCIQLVQSVQ